MVAVRWWEADRPEWEINECCVVCGDPAQKVCEYCEKWLCARHWRIAVYCCWEGPMVSRKDEALAEIMAGE